METFLPTTLSGHLKLMCLFLFVSRSNDMSENLNCDVIDTVQIWPWQFM